MNINRLRQDELVYELRIRQINPAHTVAENRKLLRQVINNGVSPQLSATFDINNELDTCSTKLQDLRQDMEDFDETNKRNEYDKIMSRLIHVRERLYRLTITDPEDEDTRKTLLSNYQILKEHLDSLYLHGKPTQQNTAIDNVEESVAQLSILDVPNPLLPEVVSTPTISNRPSPSREIKTDTLVQIYDQPQQHSQHVHFSPNAYSTTVFGRSQQLPNEDHIQESKQFFIPNFPKTPPLHKWNLVYNGETSITEFLERAEELRIARNYTKPQMFRGAVEIFSGAALNWYRSIKQSLRDWDDLVVNLRAAFLPVDYEHRLWDEIRNRTQGSGEKIICYLACMENLFNRLQRKPTEAVRLDLIKRNLLPNFQQTLALHDVYSIIELKRLCKNIEDVTERTQNYQPPPNNYQQCLEPSLAYRKPQQVKKVSVLQVAEERTETIYTRKCWNCSQQGHHARQCTQPVENAVVA